MRIAQIVASTDPKLGGPSVSVPSLARAMARQGMQVELMSTGDITEEPYQSGNFTHHVFARTWPGFIHSSASLSKYLGNSCQDVVHSNGLWLRPLHYADQLCQANGLPHVIAPRGMMSPWALNYHTWKKHLAKLFVHPGALKRARAFHATSRAEASDIQALGFKQPICVAPNGIEAPTPTSEAIAEKYWRQACPEAFDRPTALFYSRFHRKKRLLELIDLWIDSAPKDWLLLVVGFPQEYTVEMLNDYVLRNGGANQITIFDGTDAPPPYVAASIFLLPSFSESFGIVVAEALAHGLPVMVTDTTPWSSVNATDFGWCGPWEDYRSALRDALALGKEALQSRGVAAREWACAEFTWEKTARTLVDFYASLR